jgi:manganese-dependent inorganic pyrophosphatase
MRTDFPVASQDEPVRRVTMARQGLDLVPIVDGDGALTGVMTERALARRYIRESREVSRLEIPTAVEAIVDVLDGTLVSAKTPR